MAKRQMTLQGPDGKKFTGSSKTIAARSDVDLGKRKVGEQVAFRVTENDCYQRRKTLRRPALYQRTRTDTQGLRNYELAQNQTNSEPHPPHLDDLRFVVGNRRGSR
jgi:hypothetical protein